MKTLKQAIIDSNLEYENKCNKIVSMSDSWLDTLVSAVYSWLRENNYYQRDLTQVSSFEQIIRETSLKIAEERGVSSTFALNEEEATKIAEAISEAISLNNFMLLQTQAAKIKELEVELSRAYEELGHPDIVHRIREKAHKYSELCKRFPFQPGDTFYVTLSNKTLALCVGDSVPKLKIYKRTVDMIGEKGVIDTKGNTWEWNELHRTIESCRDSIPIEAD